MDSQKSAQRLLEVRESTMAAFKKLDPKDPEYAKKVDALSKLYNTAVEDYAAHSESENTKLKIQVESDIEYDKNTIEDNRNKEMERSNKENEWLKKLQIAVTGITGVLTAGTSIWAFKRSTKKEADEAYLTQTDKLTVSEGLRKGFFRFGRNNDI